MRWIDDAANVCGADWSGVPGLTSYVAAVRFCSPIGIGERIILAARLIHTGRRSVHIGVQVAVTDVVSGGTHAAAEGLLVVVSLNEHGDARPVRKWAPSRDEDVRLDQHARHLVELRQFFEPYSAATGVHAASKKASSNSIARR
jgi:acyl-CoA hydrolase